MENIFNALMLLGAPLNIIAIVLGVFFGIIIGAIPGLTSTMGVALFIPVTFSMSPATGLLFLASIYCGSTYGGSISAILIKTPGTPAAIFTAIDGYELTKQGKAGQALGMAVFASFIGGIIGSVILISLAPPLSHLVLKFGPSEIFFMALFGLTVIVGLSEDSMVKGLMSGTFGVLLATIGVDSLSGIYRFTFDKMELFEGIPLIPTVIGLFSASQVFILAGQQRQTIQYDANYIAKGSIIPKWGEIKQIWLTFVRSGIIGTIVGIIPGAGMSIACGISYNEAKRSSKNPELFGHGSLEGVAASEAANNGVVEGSLVPLLTLGIPGNAVSAVFLGGLLIHGLRPGVTLFTKHADIAYTLLIGMFLANIVMLLIGSMFAKYFAKVATFPISILTPVIMAFCVIGSFAIRNNFFDIYIMLIFGFLGYFMKKTSFPLAPFILGLILGPMLETELRRALMLSQGSYIAFLQRPISLFLFVLAILSILIPFLRRKKTSLKQSN